MPWWFLPSRESAYWLAPSTLDNASDRGQRNVLLVRRIMAICATQIRDIDEDEPVAGSGHVPCPPYAGHTGYRLEAGGTSLLIWGYRPLSLDPERPARGVGGI